MRTKAPTLTPLLRSDLQVELLALLLLNQERDWTLADLARKTGAPTSSIHREIRRALDAGVIQRDATFLPHRFRAAPESPIYEPLAMLLERTVGVETSLKASLEELGGIAGAFIHGSWARGEVTPTSDVDLVVVGDQDRASMRSAMKRVESRTGRRIDTTLMTRAEFERMRSEGGQPLKAILSGSLRWIIELGNGEPS